MTSAWPTLSAFYAADSRRGYSVEVEVGTDWQLDDRAGPWRAAWLPTTGEFYIAPVGTQSERDHGPVEVLGVLPDRFTVEVGLRGWWHRCGHAGSLGWLRDQVRQLAAQR